MNVYEQTFNKKDKKRKKPMAQPQIFEGTFEELINRGAEFAGMRLKVFALPDEDMSESLPPPPTTVRDAQHLNALLAEGEASPQRPVTEDTWEAIRQEVHRRHADRNPQA